MKITLGIECSYHLLSRYGMFGVVGFWDDNALCPSDAVGDTLGVLASFFFFLVFLGGIYI